MKKKSQKLILPFKIDNAITAAWHNQNYKNYWKWQHYGMDIQTKDIDREVIALGEGTVVASGFDSLFGGTVVIIYKNVWIHTNETSRDLVCRCFHLSKVNVHAGEQVVAGKVIGIEGNTGYYQNRMGVHLHIEFDSDTKYPCYVPGIAKDGNIIKRGTDSTIDPATIFHRNPVQIVRNVAYAGWTSKKDYTYPSI